MCGASLAHPPVATTTTNPTAAKEPVKIETAADRAVPPGTTTGAAKPCHGPSFLGLAEDPKTEFHYLYEDEEPRSYAGSCVWINPADRDRRLWILAVEAQRIPI